MNKVRGLQVDRDNDILLLDCDTVVVEDVGDLSTGGTVRAKVDDADPFTETEWRQFENNLGSLRYGEYRTTATNQATGLFFNSGVLAIPRAVRADLAGAWLERFASADLTVSNANGRKAFFAEQVAFGAAIADLDLDIEEIPVQLNWPTHIAPVPPGCDIPDPHLLHYHAMCTGPRVEAPLAPSWVHQRLDALAKRPFGDLGQDGREPARDKAAVLNASMRLNRRSKGPVAKGDEP
jgi:hypothetical protein